MKSHQTGLALWSMWIGLIGGIVGAIGGGFSIVDRVSPPKLEKIEILPVCVNASEPNSYSVFGISVIAKCQAGNRTVFVSGLDLVGKKRLSVQEYIGYTDKKKLKDIEKEVAELKPYISISWNGWPEEQGVSFRLEPYEERYVRFIFLNPYRFFYVVSEGPPYLGFEDNIKKPDRIKTSPSLFDIFKFKSRFEKQHDGTTREILTPCDLRDEFRDGSLRFQLRVGSKLVSVSPKDVIGFRLIELSKWKTESTQFLFHEQTLGFKPHP